MKELLRVFLTFFRIGAFTFGGGYAMIPLIQHEAVEKNRWVSDEDILEVIAIAESTPGPIAINAATFIGYRVAGFWGALSATLGVVVPSFLTILCVFYVLREFQDLPMVRYAFAGIRAGVLALLLKALWGMFRKAEKSPFAWGVMVCVFLAVAVLKLEVVLVLLLCGGAGWLAYGAKGRAEE